MAWSLIKHRGNFILFLIYKVQEECQSDYTFNKMKKKYIQNFLLKGLPQQ
jgi:hypothetical protein